MKTVVMVNAWEEYRKALDYLEAGGDQYPRHHLFCYDAIEEAGFKMISQPYNKQSLLNKVGRFLGTENLQQSINCLYSHLVMM